MFIVHDSQDTPWKHCYPEAGEPKNCGQSLYCGLRRKKPVTQGGRAHNGRCLGDSATQAVPTCLIPALGW